MWVYCYGSNMNQQRMIERGVIFDEMRPAKLYDYELKFNKVSKHSVNFSKSNDKNISFSFKESS